MSSSTPVLLSELPAEMWPKQPLTPNTADQPTTQDEPIQATPIRSFAPKPKRKRKSKKDVPPSDWKTWRVNRKNGKSFDTYYRDPDNVCTFCSWGAVEAYRHDGTIPKRKGPKPPNMDAPTNSGGAASQKPKKRKPNASRADGKAKSEAPAA